jgi:hypothetical protein
MVGVAVPPLLVHSSRRVGNFADTAIDEALVPRAHRRPSDSAAGHKPDQFLPSHLNRLPAARGLDGLIGRARQFAASQSSRASEGSCGSTREGFLSGICCPKYLNELTFPEHELSRSDFRGRPRPCRPGPRPIARLCIGCATEPRPASGRGSRPIRVTVARPPPAIS